jgi:hypothetical protein
MSRSGTFGGVSLLYTSSPLYVFHPQITTPLNWSLLLARSWPANRFACRYLTGSRQKEGQTALVHVSENSDSCCGSSSCCDIHLSLDISRNLGIGLSLIVIQHFKLLKLHIDLQQPFTSTSHLDCNFVIDLQLRGHCWQQTIADAG